MGPEFHTILVKLSQGVFSVDFPMQPDAAEDISITDSEGAIVVPSLEDRTSLLQIYEYLHSIGGGTNLQANLSDAKGAVFSLTYTNAVLEDINAKINLMAAELDSETLDEALANAVPFRDFVIGVGMGAFIKAVFGRLPGPLEDIGAALGNVVGLNSALEPLTDNIEDYSGYIGLLAARDAMGTYAQTRQELSNTINDILGINFSGQNAINVDDLIELEEQFAQLAFLQQQVGTLLSYANSVIDIEEFDLSLGENSPIFEFLFRPLTFDEKIALVPVLGDGIEIASLITSLAQSAQGYSDASQAMQLLQDYDFQQEIATVQTSSYFASEEFNTAAERVAEITVSGTQGDDTVFGAPGTMVVNGGAGDDLIYVNTPDETAFGHDTIIGGTGDDVVAIHGAAFDRDKLSDQRPDGSFVYRVDDDNSVMLNGVERLFFTDTQDSIPLNAEAAIFGLSANGGVIEILSSSVTDTLNDAQSGANLTVDAAGNLATGGYATASFVNSGGYYGSGASIRVVSTDPEAKAAARDDLWLGSYAWSVTPEAFEYVPGFGEVALTGAYFFTSGGGNQLASGALVVLDLDLGVEDLQGFGTWQSDEPIGEAKWYFGEPSSSDPVVIDGGAALIGEPLDSATYNGGLVALSEYVSAQSTTTSQRLLLVNLPPDQGTAYQHLAFLEDGITLTGIAYNEHGQLFGAGRPDAASGVPQSLYLINTGSGSMTDLGTLPVELNDLVLTGTDEELRALLASVAVDPDAPEPFDGTAQSDTIVGSQGGDLIAGQAGDDTITSGAGDDRVEGGDGGDVIIGQGGSDQIYGQDGDDTLFGDEAAAIYHGAAVANQVFRLYQATLDRTPDPVGHAAWSGRLATGERTLLEVTEGFVRSPEFQATYQNLTDDAFVRLLYANVLNNDAPDAAGLGRWTGELANGASRAEVVLGFSQSPQFTTQTQQDASTFAANSQTAVWSDDVFRLYQATLDRAPDLTGQTNWTGRIASGERTLLEVAEGFVASPEFQMTYQDLTEEAFVRLLYSNVLNNDTPDAAGLARWTGELANGASRAEVVLGFSQSPQFTAQAQPLLKAWMRAQGVDDTVDAGSGTNVVAGGQFADVFVFNNADNSTTTVADLEAWDYIDLNGFGYANANAARANMTQAGSDLVFMDQGTEVTFHNTTLSDMTGDMFLL